MTKEDILDLMNREIITKVVDPEKLVGKSVEELKNMGIITYVGEVNIVEPDDEVVTGEENDAPVVNDDTNTQKEPEVEDENDAPVVDEENIEGEEEE